MAIRGSMIFHVLFMIVPFCMAQIHPEPWTIPIVSDEHGNLCFGDPREQNDTAQMQLQIDEVQLTDEVPLSGDLSEELFMELPLVHVSQPQTIRTLSTDKDVESLSADLYHPVYTLMRSDKDHQIIADLEAHQRGVSTTLFQEPVVAHREAETVDTDLGTFLAYGDLSPPSVDGINIEPLSTDTEMEILLDDTFQDRKASTTSAKHSELQANLPVPVASLDSIRKDRNAGEQRGTNMVCPRFTCSERQPVGSVLINSAESFSQCGFLKSHLVDQAGQKTFTSGVQRQLQISDDFHKHRQTRTGRKQFKCDMCSKQFCSSNGYQTHRRAHTGEKPFKCDFCQKEFSDRSNYQRHLRTHNGEKLLKCHLCPKQFLSSNLYQTHRRIHTDEKPVKCDFCQEEFSDRSSYQKHRRTHNVEKPFQCDVCLKQFGTSSDYQRHRRTHTGEKPLKCDFCQKEFSDPSNYQRHRRIHNGEKPFQCDICPKQFGRSNDCQRHRRTHTGEKPLKCGFCQKEFSDPSNYQRHRRTHTGEKPFKCDFRQKEFSDPTSYKRHRRTHTGEKPFKCDFCQKEFSDLTSYKRHQRTHTGEKPFKCDICPKQFGTSSDYQRHRRTHTGEKK